MPQAMVRGRCFACLPSLGRGRLREQRESTVTICPLCRSAHSLEPITGPGDRVYRCCRECLLICVEERFRPTVKEEEERYRTHRNGVCHPGHVRFLNQALEQSLPHLDPGMSGLDYGCGPVPTLSVLLRDHGIICSDYDPIFFPNLPEGPFDFIYATECFEHFFSPDKELRRVQDLLAPGGILTIMTEQWATPEDFSAWHYARDLTHVSFYHARTIDFICSRYGFSRMESTNARVVVLKKI